ncbi:T-cell immunoreceptor with Ig and ITIM domains [Carettochelys insculpta]|uniref:T-cell immunoreceptor with Ig and ITIM domains n=1 Tax=Carettochelys insculpta TaxID=44489 RepID=UPI003EC04F18
MGNLLLLGQLLWHMAPLLHVSGAISEKILTPGNVSAVENSNVTLQCHLSVTNAIVSQVNWNQCNRVTIAVYLNKEKATVQPAFTEKVSLAAEYGITIHFLRVNDTGDYCCEFHTFPYGIYQGRMFLEVTETSEEKNVWKNFLYIIIGLVLGVFLLVCFTVWICRRKKQTQKIQVPPHVLEKVSSRSPGKECSSPNPTTCYSARANMASTSNVGDQEECDDGHNYFNILQDKGHRSRSTVVQVG